MAKPSPGLRKRGNIWHIDKRVNGTIMRESTGTSDLREAERYLTFRLEQIRRTDIYGDRPRHTFGEAADKYVAENQHLASMGTNIYALKRVRPYIDTLYLDEVHDETLAEFKAKAQALGLSAGSINKTLSLVRRILHLAARKRRKLEMLKQKKLLFTQPSVESG